MHCLVRYLVDVQASYKPCTSCVQNPLLQLHVQVHKRCVCLCVHTYMHHYNMHGYSHAWTMVWLFKIAFSQPEISTDKITYNLMIQVNETFLELKGTYRDCRKRTGNKLEYMTLCTYAITILHERWMQDTPTSYCVTW